MKVFLTGGNGNIGSAIKEKFLARGDVVVAPSSRELDLADQAAIDRYFAEHGTEFDVVVHCAGYNPIAALEELFLEEFDKAQNINVAALLSIVKNVLPYFKKQQKGYVVGIASLYASTARSDRAAYVSSKHALCGLLKTMAIELGCYNVLCNSVSPGYVDTQMFRARNTPVKISEIEAKIPLGRLALPADIAEIVGYLCSENNSYLTGQDVVVDGGFMAGGFQ